MRADRAWILLGVGALTGCSTVCKGPGCISTYSAERLSVIHWDDMPAGEVDAWKVDTRFDGSESDGADWSIVPGLPGTLIIGMPQANRVVRVPLHEGNAGISPQLEITGADGFGSSVAIADVNADGTRDLLVAASDWNFSAGAVYVFLDAGGPLGGTLTADDADWVLQGTSPGDRFGAGIHTCADLTGDGFPEIAITAPWLEDPDDPARIPNLAGAVFLYDSADLVALDGPQSPWELGAVYWGDDQGDAFGTSLLCRVDLSGDRQPDLVFGAPYAGDGKVYLIEVDDGDQPYPDSGPAGAIRDVELWPGLAQSWFGASLAFGEFDQDAPPELIVGAPGADLGEGRVEIFEGNTLFARTRPDAWRVVITFTRRNEPDHLGRFVASRDLDQDGTDDLIVGAPDWYGDNNLYDAGSLFIWKGTGIEPATTITPGSAWWTISGTQPFQRVGQFADVIPVAPDGPNALILPTRTTPPDNDN